MTGNVLWIEGPPTVCGAYFVRRTYRMGVIVEYAEVHQGTGDAGYQTMHWRGIEEPVLLSMVARTITHHVAVIPPRLESTDHVLPMLSCAGTPLRTDGVRPGRDVPFEELHRQAVLQAIRSGEAELADMERIPPHPSGACVVTVADLERRALAAGLRKAFNAIREYAAQRWPSHRRQESP